MNILLEDFVCPNCFNTFDRSKGESMNSAFTSDRHKGETFCNKCGLVVKDSSITTLAILEFLSMQDKVFKTTDLYQQIKDESRFTDAYDVALMFRAMEEEEKKAIEEEKARKREERIAKAKATREKNKRKKKKQG